MTFGDNRVIATYNANGDNPRHDGIFGDRARMISRAASTMM